MTYVSGKYQGTFVRLLRSIPELVMLIWFKFLSYPLQQAQLDPIYAASFTTAQKNIAAQTFTLSAYENSRHAPDPNALKVAPVGITVVPCPDLSLVDLIKVGNEYKVDKEPTGAILQRVGLSYSADHAFTLIGRHARVYAATSQIPAVLVYEFENVILDRLGYDTSSR